MKEILNVRTLAGLTAGILMLCGVAVLLTAAHLTDGIEQELSAADEDSGGIFD